MKVTATIEYSEQTETWTFDYEDRDQRIDFARWSEYALRVGATVTTRRAEEKP